MKAHEWLERGKNTANLVDAFPNFWRAFNNLFFTIGKGSEASKIKLFINSNFSNQLASEILQQHNDSVAYLISEKVIDMRGNGQDTGHNIKAFNSATGGKTKLAQIFMIIYQIRCNLEHGQKSPSRERDIELCNSAAPLIAEIVERSI